MSRKIDALVAEHAMELQGVKYAPARPDLRVMEKCYYMVPCEFGGPPSPRVVPNYSTNIADAWLVVLELKKEKFGFKLELEESNWRDIELKGPPQYSAGFGKVLDPMRTEQYQVHRIDTPEMAICLAALKALNIEVPGNE